MTDVVKVSRFLKLSKKCLWSSIYLLLAGDICPQHDPDNVNRLGFDIKARGLSVIHLNVRSLRGKLDELKIRLCDSKTIDVLTFSETWLQPNISDKEIQILGYTSVRYDRSAKSGGGVIIYCKSGLTSLERNDLKGNNESVWVQINRSNVNL